MARLWDELRLSAAELDTIVAAELTAVGRGERRPLVERAAARLRDVADMIEAQDKITRSPQKNIDLLLVSKLLEGVAVALRERS